jgi:hypothetical protein
VAQWAEKLAARLLEDNGNLQRFKVIMDDLDELNATASRLRELGCTVEIDLIKMQLDVTCPKDVNHES